MKRSIVFAVPSERILSGDSAAYQVYETKDGLRMTIKTRGGAKVIFEFADENQLRGFMNRLTGASMRIIKEKAL